MDLKEHFQYSGQMERLFLQKLKQALIEWLKAVAQSKLNTHSILLKRNMQEKSF